MNWILIATILSGFIVGFATGASPSPTGGSITTAVATFIVGVIAGVSQLEKITIDQLNNIGMLACLFLVVLCVTYIFANFLRKNHKLVWMGIQGAGRRPQKSS